MQVQAKAWKGGELVSTRPNSALVNHTLLFPARRKTPTIMAAAIASATVPTRGTKLFNCMQLQGWSWLYQESANSSHKTRVAALKDDVAAPDLVAINGPDPPDALLPQTMIARRAACNCEPASFFLQTPHLQHSAKQVEG